MLKLYLRRTAPVILCGALVIHLIGCGSQEPEPGFTILTDNGPLGWETADSLALAEGTYQDRGRTESCVIIDAGSTRRLRIASPQVQVSPGRTLNFRFALKSVRAAGLLFEARIKFRGKAERLLADSLLYRIRSESPETGAWFSTRWVSYTRALRAPRGSVSASVEVSMELETGRVLLGETALTGGEGWIAYASSFSTHLARSPGERYVFTAGRIIEPQAEPIPSEREQACGLLFFERKSLVDAWPYAVPRDCDRVDVMTETVPAASVAPFAFGVKALVDLSPVEVKLTVAPAGNEGELQTEPRLYQARHAATRLGSSWRNEFGVRARMLTAPEPKPLARGETRFFWLDVPVPPDAAPGVYEGRLSVQAAGLAALEVPFRIVVQPFTLPPVPGDKLTGMYYYPPDDPGLIETQLMDMAAHGVQAVSLAGSFVTFDSLQGLRLNHERVAKLSILMGLMRKHGFYRPTPLYVADLLGKLGLPHVAADWTDQDRELYMRAVRLMNNTARSRGWCPLIFFPVDEPANDPKHMELARLTLGLLRGMQGISVLCDLNSAGSVLELAKYLDAVCIQISSVSPQTLGAMEADSVETYVYLPCFGSADVGPDASYHRALAGWFPVACRLRGLYYFAYQSIEGDPYDELDGAHRD
ncbi:MAG: hypothetical protein U9P14_06405, partial [Gemmatimonadota bacterium]|nr:hypothetical protein [Gemmatimonadota bacterium]